MITRIRVFEGEVLRADFHQPPLDFDVADLVRRTRLAQGLDAKARGHAVEQLAMEMDQ